jgi:hypothetical protein
LNVSGNVQADVIHLTPPQEILGNISDNAVWETGNAYRIASDVIVLPGVTLTIQEGVLVLFEDDYWIKIFGSINVEGTTARPVEFRLHDDAFASTSDWEGVQIELDAGDCSFTGMVMRHASTALEIKGGTTWITECLFDASSAEGVFFSALSSGETEHCILRDGNVGLVASHSSPELNNNLILNMSGAGIDVQDSSEANIHHNVISECNKGIRSSWYTSPTIQHNLIAGGVHGIDAERGFTAAVEYNVFQGQSGETVYFSIGYCYPVPFEFNNFIDAPQHILYVSGSAAQQADTVYAQYNYWDGETTSQIPLRIIDGYDHGTQANPIGIVVYNPILDSPVVSAGP